jgi:hypothetical protein
MLKLKSDVWVLGSVVFVYLIFLVYGEYGFNDDYVVVGQIAQSHMGPREVLIWGLSSPYGAGRFLAAALTALVAPLLDSLESLQILRIVGALGWALVSMHLYRMLQRLNVARALSIVLSLIPILVPGSQLTLISGTNFFYSWGTLFAIWISGQIAFLKMNSRLTIFKLTFLALFPTMIYQPISSFLLLIPAISWQLQRKNYQKKANFLWAILIYLFSLLSNWILVKIFYSSPRLDGEFNFEIKIQTFFSEILPMSILPHLYIFFPELARNAFPLILIVSVIFYVLNTRFSQLRFHRGLLDSFLEVCILSGLIPLSLGWLFFIHEDGANFRKIFWGSSIWGILFLLSVGTRLLRGNLFLNIAAASLVVLTLALWTLFFRFSTVDLQQKEWSSALCASRQILLTAESELALESLRPPATLDKYVYKDEIAVHSLSFPGPAMFLPWLSNAKERPENIIPNAWGIHASAKGSNAGKIWSEKYRECWLSSK